MSAYTTAYSRPIVRCGERFVCICRVLVAWPGVVAPHVVPQVTYIPQRIKSQSTGLSGTVISVTCFINPVTLHSNADGICRRFQLGFTVQMAHELNKLVQEPKGGLLVQAQGIEVRLTSDFACSLTMIRGVSCTGQLIINQLETVYVSEVCWNMLYTEHTQYFVNIYLEVYT